MKVSIFNASVMRVANYDKSNANAITLEFTTTGYADDVERLEEVTVYDLPDATFNRLIGALADSKSNDYSTRKTTQEGDE